MRKATPVPPEARGIDLAMERIPLGPHRGKLVGHVGMTDDGLRHLVYLFGALQLRWLANDETHTRFMFRLGQYLRQPHVECELQGALR